MTSREARLLGATGVFSFLLFGAACISGQRAPLTSEIAEATRQFEAKHYAKASELCAVIAKTSSDEETRLAAQMLKAKAEINLNHFAVAETELTSYLASQPKSANALYLLGFVLERENKARESLAAYNRAAALQTPQANDLKLVGLDYVLLEDYPDAIQWLQRSVAADPTNAESWYFLGRSSMQVGDFKTAERAFRESLRLHPDDAKALDNLGLSLEAQNRNEEALVAYQKSVALPVGETSAREMPFLDLGTLLNNENRSSEALVYLRRAVELAPRNIRCQEELSRAEIAVGDLGAGLQSMRAAVTLDPDNPRLHFKLSQLYRKIGNTSKADYEAQESARLYGTHSTETKP